METTTVTMTAMECETDEVIALFGEAKLVRVRGQIELRGGSMADRTEALEWLAASDPQVLAILRK